MAGSPIPIEMGSVSTSVLSALGTSAVFLLSGLSGVAIGTVGYGAFKTYQQVAVWLEAYYDPPARIVAAYTECFEKSVKAGMSAAQASSTCQSVQASAQAYAQSMKADEGWGFWTWVGVGGAVLVAGGALALYLRGRVSRALGPARMMVPGMGGWDDGLGCGCVFGAPRRARTQAERDEDSMIRERRRADAIARSAAAGGAAPGRGAGAQPRGESRRDERMYNRDLTERIRNKPFRVSRY